MTTVIDSEQLRQFTERVFRHYGVPADDACLAADVLLWASLRGVDTHGVRNLKRYYVDAIQRGAVDPQARPVVERQSSATAALNAQGGLGLAMAARAMQQSIAMASQHGLGLVTVRNSGHFGAAGHYAWQAVAHGMIGFAATAYFFPRGEATAVVPYGGLLPMLSTNPLAMACPCDPSPPFVLDFSTSVASVNKIELLGEAGRQIPLGWALDKDGRPTTDPAAAERLVPLGGLGPLGGHKGYGLGLAVQILAAHLSGSWRQQPQADRILGTRRELKEHGFAQEGIGHVFGAVRIDSFAPLDQFQRGMHALITTLNDSPAAEGVQRVLAPGQQEAETQQRRLAEGIPLPARVHEDLRQLSLQTGIRLEV